MQVVYDYHNYYQPSISYEVGRLKPNGDYNRNIINTDNFSFEPDFVLGSKMFIGHPSFSKISILNDTLIKKKKN